MFCAEKNILTKTFGHDAAGGDVVGNARDVWDVPAAAGQDQDFHLCQTTVS